jgi:preprotein translocase subunit SecB
MARKKKKRTPANTEPALSEEQATEERTVGVRLLGVALRSVSYRELEGHAVDPQKAQSAPIFDIAFVLNANVSFPSPRRAQLTLSANVRPDPSVRPVEIDVSMSTALERDEGVSARDFLEFLSNTGGVILFPYIRHVVASLTVHGVYGHVLLNPMRVGPLLEHGAMERLAKQLSEAERS